MWAENEQNPKKHFAVSVGVRDYIRPVFLYAKLCDLENSRDATGIALQDVKAFQCVDRHSKEYKSNKKLESKYKHCEKDTNKNPCTSCEIFFNTFKKKEETQFNYFGNCAEYDLVQTKDARKKLGEIKDKDHWKSFESQCESHISASNDMLKFKRRTRRRQLNKKQMEEYFNKTRNTNLKALKYKWINSKSEYKLVTRDYNPNKKRSKSD